MASGWSENLTADENSIEQFCELWGISRIDVYGSALTSRFADSSDIDLIVEFEEDVPFGGYRLEAASALEKLFGRKVDICTFEGLEQSKNREAAQAILKSGETLYVRQ